MKRQDVYKETRTFYFPNMIARVHIPDLTEEEHERRMKLIREATANLIKDCK